MNLIEFLKNIEIWEIAVAVGIPVLGWFINEIFKRKSERRVQKIKHRIEFLFETFLLVESCFNDTNYSIGLKIQQLYTRVQIIGSKEQIKLVHKIGDELKNGGNPDLAPLLNSLRKDFRDILGLKMVNDVEIRWFRVELEKNSKIVMKKDVKPGLNALPME